jgi:hypothetical protein
VLDATTNNDVRVRCVFLLANVYAETAGTAESDLHAVLQKYDVSDTVVSVRICMLHYRMHDMLDIVVSLRSLMRPTAACAGWYGRLRHDCSQHDTTCICEACADAHAAVMPKDQDSCQALFPGQASWMLWAFVTICNCFWDSQSVTCTVQQHISHQRVRGQR